MPGADREGTHFGIMVCAYGGCKLPGDRGGQWESSGSWAYCAVVTHCTRFLSPSASAFVPRVFLALVAEAEDRGGVVAQGGGKVRRQAPLWGCGKGKGGCDFTPSSTSCEGAGAACKLVAVLQALIPLSLEGTEVGQTKAAQALAKITITSNPEMAFPGERVRVPIVGSVGLPVPVEQDGARPLLPTKAQAWLWKQLLPLGWAWASLPLT